MVSSITVCHAIDVRCTRRTPVLLMGGVVVAVFAAALVSVVIASPAMPASDKAVGQDVPLILGSWDASKCKAKFKSGETFKLKNAASPKGFYTASGDGFAYMFQVCGNMVFTSQADAPKCGFSSSNGSDCPRACMGKVCGDACAAIQVRMYCTACLLIRCVWALYIRVLVTIVMRCSSFVCIDLDGRHCRLCICVLCFCTGCR